MDDGPLKVRSVRTRRFRELFDKLPVKAQEAARKAFRIWQESPFHPSLQFKRVGLVDPIFSVRIGKHYRALGALDGNDMVWYWIGTHGEYDRKVKDL